MFGRRKMYKKGMSDAMRAYEDFGKKQEAAIAHIREDVSSGKRKLEDALTSLASLGDDLDGIYKYLNAQEKAALYHLSTPMDLKDLETEDKYLLLAILYQLAENEEHNLTDNQRAYIRSIQKYLEITNPQTFADFSSIDNIDSMNVQKTFMRVALEFFYLQDGNELSDDQEEFFDYFSVNKKHAVIIENEVSRLYNAVGPEGLAEKYGVAPELMISDITDHDILQVDVQPTESGVNDSADHHAEKITGEVVDWLVNIAFDNFRSRLYKKFKVHETPNHIHYGDILLDKQTIGVCRVAITTGRGHDSIPCYYGDSAIYFEEDTAAHDADAGNVWRCDFSALNPAEKLFPMKGWRNTRRSICGKHLVFNDSESGLNIYDIEKKSTKKIPLANEGRYGSYVQAIFAAAKGVYYSYYDYPTYSVNFYKYGADSSQRIFKTSEQIEKIYYVREDGKMLVEFGYKTGISLLDFSDAQKDTVLEPIKTFDVWLPQSTYAEAQIVPYHDCLVYTAKRGIIKSIDYKTFEAAELIDGAAKDGKPGEFCRIGDWIVYDENGNADKTYRVSLKHPGEKFYVGEFDAEKAKELRKSIPERESPTSTNKKPEETSSGQKNILEKAIGELKNYWFLYS